MPADEEEFKLYIEKNQYNAFRKWVWAIVPARIFNNPHYYGSPTRDATIQGECFTEAGARREGERAYKRFRDGNVHPVRLGGTYRKGYLVDVEETEFEELQRRLRSKPDA